MQDPKLLIWLSESKFSSSDESESSSWSDGSIVGVESEEYQEDYNDDQLFFPLMQYLIRRRRKRADDYLHIIDSWSDIEFKSRMRISRKTALKLIDDLGKSGFIASHKFGLKPLEPKLCFYIFLSFIGTTEPLTPIASRFDISISSTFRVLRRVIAWILTKLDDAVKWPQEFNEIKSVCDTFEIKTGISNIIGVIDASHIKIEKPKNARDNAIKRDIIQ
ncbi:uncharacterized protein LOC114358318 [Ostrinia furnacalis]|uniref:uncharacterized protein LOC114358318 n=1 Tax=Ostrinia furnacalis TaxID=93504 RepID=UPI0010398019|nr:uncharacterized protein LOC114358318 [Ostrinia furnacalis]